MTSLSTLNILLSQELGDSETINKTVEQRNNCINDACRQVYEYRKWPEKYINTTTQAVDGIITIPADYDIETALWFGKTQSSGVNNYQFVNQTDFFIKNAFQATVTEYHDEQVIWINQQPDRGYTISQKEEDSTIGIGDTTDHSKIGNTFIANSNLLEGAMLKLNKVGLPTGSLSVQIFETVGGFPTGSAIASGTILLRDIKTTSEYHWAKFLFPPSITEDDLYAITVTPSYAVSATDYIEWSFNTVSQIDGNQILFDGVDWTDGVGDQTMLLATDYFNFQYVKTFLVMTDSTDDNGLTSKFDQAISKLACGIMDEIKMEDDKALRKFYGAGGNQSAPTQNSAFGLLDLIWTNQRVNSMRENKRLKTIYDAPSRIASNYTYYY